MTIQPVPQLDELAHAEAMFASVQVTLAELREALECLRNKQEPERKSMQHKRPRHSSS